MLWLWTKFVTLAFHFLWSINTNKIILVLAANSKQYKFFSVSFLGKILSHFRCCSSNDCRNPVLPIIHYRIQCILHEGVLNLRQRTFVWNVVFLFRSWNILCMRLCSVINVLSTQQPKAVFLQACLHIFPAFLLCFSPFNGCERSSEPDQLEMFRRELNFEHFL